LKQFFKRKCKSKRECITYVVIFLWIYLGVLSTIYEHNLESLSVYFLSLTGFVGSFIVEWLGAADFEDKSYGVRASFRVLGVTALGMASLYLLFNLFYIRPQNNKVMKKQNSIPLLVQNRDNENPQLNNDTTV
jgi:uncharacterized membrane protein